MTASAPDRGPEVRDLLASIDERQAKLVERLEAPARKHWVDYLGAVAAIVTPLVIALGGWMVTQRVESLKLQEQRESREQAAANHDLQVLQPLLPYLFGDDEEKKENAVEMIRRLGDPRLAAYAASMRPSPGTAIALRRIAASPGITPVERREVLKVLNGFPDSLRLTAIPVDSTSP